jgi:hypothetical protein
MAVFQVLSHFAPDTARGLKPSRNPGRVIGFHLPSITQGTDIGSPSTATIVARGHSERCCGIPASRARTSVSGIAGVP